MTEEEAKDLVNKYRAWRPLYDRSYQDDRIGGCVFAINRRIRHAVFQGADDLACGLAQLLAKAEPLERPKTLWGKYGHNSSHIILYEV